MYCIILLLSTAATVVLMFQQDDYVVKSERFEFSSTSDYIKNLKYTNYKYNRTHAALNVSADFDIDFGDTVTFYFQAFKFLSNEYRIFPLEFEVSVCDIIRKNTFGIQNTYLTKCGNVPRCPFVKGSYSLCRWQPDFRKFPPRIPTGRYRADFNFSYNKEHIAYAQWYAEIKRD